MSDENLRLPARLRELRHFVSETRRHLNRLDLNLAELSLDKLELTLDRLETGDPPASESKLTVFLGKRLVDLEPPLPPKG